MGVNPRADAFAEIVPLDDPFAQRRALHKHPKDIMGLESFVTKTFLRVLQEVFGGVTWTDEFRWMQDAKRTKVHILDRFPEDYKDDPKPIVIVERGPITCAGINGRGRNEERLQGTGVNAGKVILTYRDVQQCGLAVHCCGKRGIATGRMASLVYGTLVTEEIWLKPRGIHAVLNPVLGAEQPSELGADYELMETVVEAQVQFGWAWGVEPHGPTFDFLETTVLTS